MLLSTTAKERKAGPARYACFFLLFLITFSSRLGAETVTVSIKLDYPLLEQLMLNRLFNAADHSAEILHDPSDCNQIYLSDPRLGEENQQLEIITKVRASLGAALMGTCTDLLQWTGEARLLTKPVILSGNRSVGLELVNARLYNRQGELVSSGRLWDLLKGRYQPLFGRFQVDLDSSIRELRLLLPEVLPHHSAQQLQAVVDSLRLSAIRAETTGVDVDVSFHIEAAATPAQPERALSEQELQQWEANWQMMDSVITAVVKHYAKTTQYQALRETLLEILLDARYRLQDALTLGATSEAQDPVRHWFISSWERLSPVLRQISLENPGQEALLLLGLLAAADTLRALDRLGPAVGLDISADGLRRLARMVNQQPGVDPLRYEQAVDPELRRLLQLQSSPEPPEPAGLRFDFWPIRSAHADTATDRLNHWVPKKSELNDYLPLVHSLLKQTATTTVTESPLEPRLVTLYDQVVMATSWQESCWRQYVVKQKKRVPLRSTTGDVGLMQLNERVWRGFYDIQKLRWDITYNSRAGAEVLLNYLVRYALKNGEQKRQGGLDNLARATYSAYNGGPSQVARYRNPAAAAGHKKIDAAFWEKYRAVQRGEEGQVARCLGGENVDLTLVESLKTKQQSVAPERSHKTPAGETAAATPVTNDRWVLQQDDNHFTLQLGAFSTPEAAEDFVDRQSLSGVIASYPVLKDKRVLYAVLYGSYEKRTQAEQARRSLGRLKPWIRQFKELKK